MKNKIIIIGSGNAALCAGIAALERGAEVIILEKASVEQAGGNSRYTAGAMRFVYESKNDLLPLLSTPSDDRIAHTHFGSYPKETFKKDLLAFNERKPLSLHQQILIDQSYETVYWLSTHNIKFEPIYKRQAFQKDGKYVFWGGLTLACNNEGVGMVEAEVKEFHRLNGRIYYNTEAISLIQIDGRIVGVKTKTPAGPKVFDAAAVILACGGFEANAEMRKKYMGEKWVQAKVRGTPHNQGKGIEMAVAVGAQLYGLSDGCHATPMDAAMPDYGNLAIPHIERKNYRKICYFLGIMLNAEGKRFVDEGQNFRNYTYAQFGRQILNQPSNIAWQIFDHKVDHLLYDEYRFWDAHFLKAETLDNLLNQIDDINRAKALATIDKFNHSVDHNIPFDPTVLDGKSTQGLALNKTNWANAIDTPPFKAYPVTCGITFTYAGLKVDANSRVLNIDNQFIKGLFACGEMVGGVFYHGYPGGSGLTSGSVFGRLAGYAATDYLKI